jgi:hypothetical protein
MTVLALSGVLAGCANGDFDRVRPLLVRDEIHDWVGRKAVEVRGIPSSEFRITDDERHSCATLPIRSSSHRMGATDPGPCSVNMAWASQSTSPGMTARPMPPT